MPVVYKEDIGTAGRIHFWEVTEAEETLLDVLPAALLDSARLAQFTHPYRRRQWLGSRALLHEMLPGSSISYDDAGKPHLQGAAGFISFSHSGDFIALVHDTQPTGIDIERIRPGIERIAPKFIHDREMEEALKEPSPERLHTYWCVKEAIYKVYGRKGISLKNNIFVYPLTFTDPGYAVAEITDGDYQLKRNLKFRTVRGLLMACIENNYD
jgi:4'-phosphopantetheinyl transferase